MNPTQTDVLSGRGAGLNRHPGNVYFRKLIEEKKTTYQKGTKKAKMMISKAIVEEIYSRQPPGRFLKKCAVTGQWQELPKKEAADKAAQAMAYIINGESLKIKRRERKWFSNPHPSSKQPQDDACTASSQSADQVQVKLHPANNNHLIGNKPSLEAARYVDSGGEPVDSNKALSADQLNGNSNRQQQLLQQSSTITNPPPILGMNPQDHNRVGSVQMQSQISQLQRQQYQQQLMLRNSLSSGPHTSLELALMLNQAQQQQQQQMQLLLLLQQQDGWNHHNMQSHPLISHSTSLAPPASSLPVPSSSHQGALMPNGRNYLTGSQQAANNSLQNPVAQRPQSESNVNVHSMRGNLQNQLSYAGTATAPHESQPGLRTLQTHLTNPVHHYPTAPIDHLRLQQQFQQPQTFPLQQWQTAQIQENSQESQTTNEPSSADRRKPQHRRLR